MLRFYSQLYFTHCTSHVCNLSWNVVPKEYFSVSRYHKCMLYAVRTLEDNIFVQFMCDFIRIFYGKIRTIMFSTIKIKTMSVTNVFVLDLLPVILTNYMILNIFYSSRRCWNVKYRIFMLIFFVKTFLFYLHYNN